MNRPARQLLRLAMFGLGVTPSVTLAQATFLSDSGQKRKAIAALVNEVDFGVPATPAFALLPSQPSQVPHLEAAADLVGQVHQWYDGSRILQGAAMDARPFVGLAGPLVNYRAHPAQQALWRTIVSVGTAAATNKKNDVIVAVGARIPLVDRSDPRASWKFIDSLNVLWKHVSDSIALERRWYSFDPTEHPVPNPLAFTLDTLSLLDSLAETQVKDLRDGYRRQVRNAFQLDVGLAGSLRALSGVVAKDSVQQNQGGVWVAAAFPVSSIGQLTISGKGSWSHRDTVVDESARYVTGMRFLAFLNTKVAASAEYVRFWSRHNGQASLNEAWNRIAVVLEVPAPAVKGWLAVGYGGDTPHRNSSKQQLSFQYAIYSNRIIPSP
jgi:hypothetical protein